MPFLLDGNPTPSEISEAINYILANLSPQTPPGQYVVNNNPETGFISNSVGTLLQYQYRYLDVKYADNTAGLNFTDNPYGRLYFGIYNTDTVTESVDPNQYTWFQVTGGFGATKTLLVVTAGGCWWFLLLLYSCCWCWCWWLLLVVVVSLVLLSWH